MNQTLPLILLKMDFDKKIYYNNKPIVLTNSARQYLDKHPNAAGYLFLKKDIRKNYGIAKSHLNSPKSSGLLLEVDDDEILLKELQDLLMPKIAAGGIVYTPDKKVLLIFRNGKWDLPKGKLEEGETIEECALREIKEETGLADNVRLGKEICRTRHIYPLNEMEILKITHWHAMEVDEEWPLTPQQEEGITKAKWIPQKELPYFMEQSWQNIRDVFVQTGDV